MEGPYHKEDATAGPDGGSAAEAGPGAAGLAGREDRLAQAAGVGRGAVPADAELAAAAERHASLMDALALGGEGAPPGGPEGYLREPGKVIDDLVRRRSVFRAGDAASRLARAAPDSAAFLRMFREAMSRPDVVLLSEDDGRGARVYTTRGQLDLELRAVDLGVRLALSLPPDAAPRRPLAQARTLLDSDLDPNQRAAAVAAAAPGRLRLVDGAPGSGRDAAIRIVAELHARAGWSVIGAAPADAGLDGLRRAAAGGARLRALDPLLGALGDGSARLDPGTVVLLDAAGRVGAREALDLFERVDAAGAKLVAFLDDGELAPREAGPVFRALRIRVGAARLNWAYEGTQRRATAMGGLQRGGEDAARALDMLAEDGALAAGEGAAGAAREAAQGWIGDRAWDKIALARSRAEADGITAEIRRGLHRRSLGRILEGAVQDGPFKGLMPGDRVRFLARPEPGGRGLPAEARLVPGERAEFLGLSGDGSAVFDAMGLDGAMRRASVPPGAAPEWRFDFAGTIRGEAGRTFESVHVVAGKGMSRQLLAAGARTHVGSLRIVAPAPEDGMRAALDEIVSRDAAPECALDHGFDPAFAARAATRGHAAETRGARAGLASAAAGLRRIAGLGDAAPSAVPSAALPQGFEGEALAEVIGAAILGRGEAPAGAERLALESHVASLANPAAWRRMLRQAAPDLSGRADALAREAAGTVRAREPGGEEMAAPAARILARGALSARALGDEALADMYEEGLRLHGRRAATARARGQSRDRAAPAAAREREGRREAVPPGREAPERPARFRSLSPYRLLVERRSAARLVREVVETLGIRSPRPRWRRYGRELRRRADFLGRAGLAREAEESAGRDAAQAGRGAAREAGDAWDAAARADAAFPWSDVPRPALPEPVAAPTADASLAADPPAAEPSSPEPAPLEPAPREAPAPSWDAMLGQEPQNWDALPGNAPFAAQPRMAPAAPARQPLAPPAARRAPGAAARYPFRPTAPAAPLPAQPDEALAIAVAVSARVEDGHEAHSLDLPRELAGLLGRAESAPADAGVRAVAERLANRRAAADAKLALAEAVVAREQRSWDRHRGENTPEGRAWATRKRPEFDRAMFMKMEPEWDPKAPGADPAIHHPLFLQRPSARAAYDARVDRAAAEAWEYGSEPSRTELAAARILRLEDAPRGLVEAITTALSRGAARSAAELRREREAVMGALARAGQAGPGRGEADEDEALGLVQRLYGAFTRGEVEALARNRGAPVRSRTAPGRGGGDRIARGIEAVVARASNLRLGYHPWAGHAARLADGLRGPLDLSRARGQGVSMLG